jgi:RimJ/RimL family protein N-acetyltransferase
MKPIRWGEPIYRAMLQIDKGGHPFEVRPFETGGYPYLEEMYDGFSPKGAFQGMPPFDKEACVNWIAQLIKNAENFLAWREGRVIGHVALIPDFKKGDAEYLIFVNQSNRGRGVGTELTRTAIEKAKALGLTVIWLSVNRYNFRAVRLYRKFGFQFRGCLDLSERMMILEL